jgi:hypothetical protein
MPLFLLPYFYSQLVLASIGAGWTDTAGTSSGE